MTRSVFIAAILSISLVLIMGLAIVGGPTHARMEGHDDERLRDLHILASLIDCGGAGQALPETIEKYNFCGYTAGARRDPVTDVPYSYQKTENNTFEVCATLDLPEEQSLDQQFGVLMRREGEKSVCLRFNRNQ